MVNYNEKFNGIYRIDSIRIKNWDYRSNAIYFVTICIKDRKCILGKIYNRKMHLSKEGRIVNYFWNKIFKNSSYVIQDKFIVMPNHIHGIIGIYNEKNNCKIDKSTRITKKNDMSEISPKSGSLSAIIRTYKSVCTRKINQINGQDIFKWQERFYESKIRDRKSIHIIRKYIISNPYKWGRDRNKKMDHPDNLV